MLHIKDRYTELKPGDTGTVAGISAQCSAESSINWIKEEYHKRTDRGLSKSESAKSLAPAVKQCNEITNSVPEQLLDQIRMDINGRLNITVPI